VCFLAVVTSGGAQAQNAHSGFVVVPASSMESPEDAGHRAHTNHMLFVKPEATAGPSGMTPEVILAAYNLPAYFAGQAAGSDVIAIVDAYDYPTALADFNAFSRAFGLPEETGNGSVFQVLYARGVQPAYNAGWSQESALDIEWAHAMAPTAKIVLVEAASNSFDDLLEAVDVAETIPNVRQISMSWGASEFKRETSYDSRFNAAGVVYFAASGDTGGKTIWPGVSSKVVSAGGTTLAVDASGAFVSETAWSGSGGGKSKFESRPAWQNALQGIVGAKRGTPDISFDADPQTGVSVLWQGSWLVFGGTSVSSPSLAGIVNLTAATNGFATGTDDELGSRIYANLVLSSPAPDPTSEFRDIIAGAAGRNRAALGWDFTTGIGTVWGVNGK
jgi:subtilase family serine protease